MPDQTPFTLCCSFCRKGAGAVKKLVAGPGVFICDACVEICATIIRDSPDAERPRTPEELMEASTAAHAQSLAGMKALKSETLLEALVASEQGVEGARRVLQSQIDVLREREVSWAQIGAALGISRQAAWERFG